MNKKISLFVFLVIGFIVATVVGTLTHESGHYLTAKFLGHDARISYGMTFLIHFDEISSWHRILITMAGPIETILTGIIGFILLFISRKKYLQKENLNLRQWILIFISLFWLRPVANFCIWIGGYIFSGKFPDGADEINISRYFHLPDGLILLTTALMGIMVLIVVIFQFIPAKTRALFLFSGLVGGISGYILWLKLLGPILLP